jgi:hypothetical protein
MSIFEPLKCACSVCMRVIEPQSIEMHAELLDIIPYHAPLYKPDANHNFFQIFLNYHIKPPRILAAVYSPDKCSISYINNLNKSSTATEFCSDIGHTLHVLADRSLHVLDDKTKNRYKYTRSPNIPPSSPFSNTYSHLPPIHVAFSISTSEYHTACVYDLTDIVVQRDEIRRFAHVATNPPQTYLYHLPLSILISIAGYLYDNPVFNNRQLLYECNLIGSKLMGRNLFCRKLTECECEMEL